MLQVQRLRLEQNLASARRALFRAQQECEDAAFYEYEDAVNALNLCLGAVMNAVQHSQERPDFSQHFRTYLGYSELSDDSASPRVSLR